MRALPAADRNSDRPGERRYAGHDHHRDLQHDGYQQLSSRHLSHHRDGDWFFRQKLPGGGERGNADHLAGYAQTLTVTANNATRVYGAANPTFTGTITGAQNGDTFTESFSTTATTTSNVGSYPIVPAASGTNLGNYTVSIVDGTLTVTAATTTTTIGAPGSTTYSSSVTLTATVASTAGTPAGVVTFYNGSTALGTGTLNGSG